MPASVDGIFNQINCSTANTSILPVCTMAKLSGAAGLSESAASSTCHWVSTCSALPPAACVAGAFYYIQDRYLYVYSNGSTWKDDYTVTQQENRLYSWGLNAAGNLGDSSLINKSTIGLTCGGGVNWKSVYASPSGTSYASKTDGTFWSWGCNNQGQMGDNTLIGKSSPTCVPVLAYVGSFSGGSSYAMAATYSGLLFTWGLNGSGQLGNGNTIGRSSPGLTAGLTEGWKLVSAGNIHSLAIKTDGTLWTWGGNTCGVLGTGNTTSRSSPGTVAGGGTNWATISAGETHSLATKKDGTLWVWGANTCGALGTGNTTNFCSPVTTAGGGTTWCQASGGQCLSAAVKTDGTIWTWGMNTSGQLGDNSTINKSSPVTVAGGGTTWFEVSTGLQHILAKKTDGSLWAWGLNNAGQLGDNTIINRSSPITVISANTNWTEVSAGANYSLGVQSTVIIS